MSMTDAFGLAASIIASVGGAGAIIFGLADKLGKVWADRLMEKEKTIHSEQLEKIKAKYSQELEELKSKFVKETEQYKVQLKKSEFLFEKQYEAAADISALVRHFSPGFYHPDMDWGEACEDIALSSEAIEKDIDKYLAKHKPVLSEQINEQLTRVLNLAAECKFKCNKKTGDVTPEGRQLADELFTAFQEAEKLSTAELNSQVST